ncbi:MAG: deoxyribonuclease IV, partial [Candidatus Helarchaeota archaeon]
MRLGAHMPIGGGIYKSIERGYKIGCESIQIFTKSNRQWKAKPLSDEDIDKFIETKKKFKDKIFPIFAHTSYLINLAAPDTEIYEKSLDAMLIEMQRAEALKLPYLVLHPGSHLDKKNPITGLEKGIKRIAKAINKLHKQTEGFKVVICLETMAGQGTNIGKKFEEIADIIKLIDDDSRIGVCFDTCHSFAAGYDIRTEKAYNKTWEEFDNIIGLVRLKVFHINDSQALLAKRKDRHEHIGKGKIGKAGFKLLLNDPRFKNYAGVLETPKGKDLAEDVENLKVL